MPLSKNAFSFTTNPAALFNRAGSVAPNQDRQPGPAAAPTHTQRENKRALRFFLATSLWLWESPATHNHHQTHTQDTLAGRSLQERERGR